MKLYILCFSILSFSTTWAAGLEKEDWDTLTFLVLSWRTLQAPESSAGVAYHHGQWGAFYEALAARFYDIDAPQGLGLGLTSWRRLSPETNRYENLYYVTLGWRMRIGEFWRFSVGYALDITGAKTHAPFLGITLHLEQNT